MNEDPHAGQPIVARGRPLGTAPAAILVHGRNAGPENILDVVSRLDRPAFTYLAPAAAGRTWYPLSFLAPRDQNEPWLSSALRALAALVAHVESNGVAADRLVIVGFSQGACLASEFVLRHPRRYGGLVAWSGGCIGPPGTSIEAAGSLEGTPMFFGCSDVDAHVPQWRVDESAAAFARAGAQVTTRIYPGMGHLIDDDEIAEAQRILDALA